jgi:hypothetical protein
MNKEPAIKVKTVGTPMAESIKYRLTSDTMINLTRSKAFEVLEYDTFSGERPVREGHVQYLYNEWLAGRFLWHQAMIAHGIIMESHGGQNNPHLYRLNGQHTCWMRVNIPKEKEPSVCKVRQLIYECQDLDGLREIYSVIDRNAPRTNAHITKVLLADDIYNIPLSYLNNLVAGMRLWQWEGQWDRKFKGSPQEVAALIQDKRSDLFRIVGTYFQIKYTEWQPIRRSGVVAALFATFDKAGGLAPDFWDKTCSGIALESKTDPRYQLRQFLQDHHTSQNGKNNIGAEDTYRICINCWNKWRKKEDVVVVRTTEMRVKPL